MSVRMWVWALGVDVTIGAEGTFRYSTTSASDFRYPSAASPQTVIGYVPLYRARSSCVSVSLSFNLSVMNPWISFPVCPYDEAAAYIWFQRRPSVGANDMKLTE